MFQTPFSGSKRAADFIRRNGYASLLIVGSQEANVSPVTAYLDRPIYYPDSARYGTFPCESSARRDLSEREVLSQTAQLARTEHADILLILSNVFLTWSDNSGPSRQPFTSAWLCPDGTGSKSSEPPVKPYLKITFLAEFRAIGDESYYLYIVGGAHEN
jgi:hypothetical protein